MLTNEGEGVNPTLIFIKENIWNYKYIIIIQILMF